MMASGEVDQRERALRAYVLMWSIAGLILGGLLGVLGVAWFGWSVWMVAVCALVGWACAYFGPLLITGGGARLFSRIHNPSGASTPHAAEYSYAESLLVRGRHLEAITAFELAVKDHTSDPTPYLRIARIYRDAMAQPEAAERWFKRALAEADVPDGLATLIRRELVELYEHRMMSPARAAPLLARIAEEQAGTPEGEWAAAELAHVKEAMEREHRRGGE